jgi:glucose/arabinose dehydrogenase
LLSWTRGGKADIMRIGRSITILACCACGLVTDAAAQIRTTVYASGFSSPVAFVQDPTDRTVQFVVEQGGRIRAIRSGAVQPTDFLNLTSDIAFGGEQGLLGLAFAPDSAMSGRFFVNFTDTAGNTVVARFKRSANPLVADASSRFDLRWGGPGGLRYIVQPYSNHNGGNLAFGPDGFLYIGLGDGGAGNDPDHRAQNPSLPLGKMLRIDVNVPDSDPSGYQVPSSNPFVSGGPVTALPEIWSFGLRNPWRYSFDDPARGGTGALVIGDVGEDAWEEIDYEPPNHGGRNYGWRNREGAHDNVTSLSPAYLPLRDPTYEYDHSAGEAIVGGYVYRGNELPPGFRGRYFFADYVDGRVWSLALTIDPTTGEATASNVIEHTAELGGFSRLGNVSSFGVDAAGELYILSLSRGTILKIAGSGMTHSRARPGDFDGDSKADITVYRPSTGVWYTMNSSTNYTTYATTSLGVSTDIPVPGDYDGDGKVDCAVFRPSTGVWYISQSSYDSSFTIKWGVATDVPVPADYDGDGITDIAVFRPSTGMWFVLYSSANYTTYTTFRWGLSSDITVPADYDGDGKTDIAVYRPSTGTWFVLYSSTSYTTYTTFRWGLSSDITVPADYDGDGKTDIAVYRPSTGRWFILYSMRNYTTFTSMNWGVSDDTPVPGDYDGDGKADLAVFRPSTGVWFVVNSSTSYSTFSTYRWGVSTDIPVLEHP